MKAKTLDRAYFWLLVPFVAALIAIGRVWPVLPAVMQDEYVYSMQARFTQFVDQIFPNYLYSALYSATNFCGANFYQCNKFFNGIFFLITLCFLFLISKRFLSIRGSAAVVAIAALSPINVYVSYFMPESMYFALMTATVWSALRASSSLRVRDLLLVGSLLGLTALVKPHAIFALPAFFAYSLISNLNSNIVLRSTAWIRSTYFVMAFFLVKFGLGFLFAGTNGLTIFGRGYESSISKLTTSQKPKDDASLAVSTLASDLHLQTQGEVAAVGYPGFLDVVPLHGLGHIAVLVGVFSIPLVVGLRFAWQFAFKNKKASDSGLFLAFISLISFSFIAVVSVFEGFVTLLGDDHSSRLITRYYEFLIPFAPLVSLMFLRFSEKSKFLRFAQSITITGIAIFGVSSIGFLDFNFSDSAIITGVQFTGLGSLLIFIMGLGFSLIWPIRQELARKIFAYFVTPLTVLSLGFLSQSALNAYVGSEPAFFDLAGQRAKVSLDSLQGRQIVVVGPQRTQNFTVKFWIDKPEIGDINLDAESVLPGEQLSGYFAAVLLDGASVEGNFEVISEGAGFQIIKIG